uniref:cytoplasmic protein n=1 Tax=uncultured Draconibacterium sp. TaxID=1573823 RepID=UPI0032178ED4
MNDLIQIKVKCHSGYKSNEYPKYFYWDGIRFNVLEIIDRWYQGDLNPEFTPVYYFKVKTEDAKLYILKYEELIDKWFLLIHGESINL